MIDLRAGPPPHRPLRADQPAHPGHAVSVETDHRRSPVEHRAVCATCGPVSPWGRVFGEAHNAGRAHVDGVGCCS